MALKLGNVRQLFQRRSRTVAFDVEADVDEHENGELHRTKALKTYENKPGRLDPVRGYDEVIGLVRKIGDHLDRQTDRTEQLITLMDRVPQALDALPEINRQNARLLEALHEHLGQAKSREEALNDTLTTITQSTGRQTDVLGLIQQQLDTNNTSAAQFNETLGELRTALTDLAVANRNSTTVLERMAEASMQRESELASSLARTQRWTLGAIMCCGAASVVALGLAVMAMLG